MPDYPAPQAHDTAPIDPDLIEAAGLYATLFVMRRNALEPPFTEGEQADVRRVAAEMALEDQQAGELPESLRGLRTIWARERAERQRIERAGLLMRRRWQVQQRIAALPRIFPRARHPHRLPARRIVRLCRSGRSRKRHRGDGDPDPGGDLDRAVMPRRWR
jgi:hypothetical protein